MPDRLLHKLSGFVGCCIRGRINPFGIWVDSCQRAPGLLRNGRGLIALTRSGATTVLFRTL